jgi:hypothetical protein
MGKYLSIIAGSVIGFVGLVGLIAWSGDLFTIIRGTLPILLFFAGIIAVIAGISELKEEASSKK